MEYIKIELEEYQKMKDKIELYERFVNEFKEYCKSEYEFYYKQFIELVKDYNNIVVKDYSIILQFILTLNKAIKELEEEL